MPLSHTPDGMHEKFSICMKKPENDSLIGGIQNLMKMMNRDRELDENSSFSPPSGDRFRIFSYRWKIFLACHQIHTKMALNADRRYYRDGVMIGIEDLMKIKPAKHASQ